MKDSTTLTVPRAARQLRVTLKYVYDLVYSGRLRAEKVAGRWKIPASEVARLELKRSQ